VKYGRLVSSVIGSVILVAVETGLLFEIRKIFVYRSMVLPWRGFVVIAGATFGVTIALCAKRF